MCLGIIRKIKQKNVFKKRFVKGIKMFQKKKIKSKNMVVNGIGIFLKKKETKSLSMVVNDVEIFEEI